MKKRFCPFRRCIIFSICLSSHPGNLAAQETTAVSGISREEIVTYSNGFFQRYQVTNALDMVNRVPGFTLDNGGRERGFGNAAGNILINDRRPSTKQDAPSAILGRISSELVERIELIRIRIRDIDLQGHTQVVNVVLREDTPAIIQWEFNVRQNFEDKGTSPYASLSLADRWQNIEFNIGIDGRYPESGDPGSYRIFDPEGILIETREDEEFGKGPDLNVYLNSATWLGSTFVQTNAKAGLEYRDYPTVSTRTPRSPPGDPRQELFNTMRRNRVLELGADAERVLHQDLLGKAILLYSLELERPEITQKSINASGQQTSLQFQDEDRDSTELITRLEFDWTGFSDHALQMDLERALNILDNEQVFTEDTGSGPVVIDIPGSNVRVEEVRWNFLAQDTWSLGEFTLEYGLGLEHSTLSQSGDSNLDRSFTFVKPRSVLTWAPVREHQSRLRLEREVAQLDFSDFVSATVFLDNKIAFGNPDLRPDTTWIAEASHEVRFGEIGVVSLTGFHHWIKDVQDLLPLGPEREVPGNIGNGRRWGLILETTSPLEWIGLSDARLDFRIRWQDSTVTDPVTGVDRVLSGDGGNGGTVRFLNENRYAIAVEYRQDFESERVSWGWSIAERARRPLYRANELDVFNDGVDMLAFIETTRWYDLNMRLEFENLLNLILKRDRTIFAGERTLSPVRRIEQRRATTGTRLIFTVSGAF